MSLCFISNLVWQESGVESFTGTSFSFQPPHDSAHPSVIPVSEDLIPFFGLHDHHPQLWCIHLHTGKTLTHIIFNTYFEESIKDDAQNLAMTSMYTHSCAWTYMCENINTKHTYTPQTKIGKEDSTLK